jgi:hypothetical protein
MMKLTRSALLLFTAVAGLAAGASSASAQTTTVAAFFDPSFTSNNTPMFFRNGPLFTGGWSGTGLTLFTPGLMAVPDFNDVTFTMTPLVVVGGAFPQETLSSGVITFRDNTNTPILFMSFDAAHLSPFGFGAADFFFDNVTFSGPILTGIGAVSANEQFGFSFANLVGNPATNFSATASFTSSAQIIIPAPASAALMGAGGLLAARRRRR